MKEATAELNATVMIIAAIAGLSVLFFSAIWPIVRESAKANNKCSDAICKGNPNADGMVECEYTPYKINVHAASPGDRVVYCTKETINCPYKG